ncbi:MAG TPA: hypothetical protein VHL79_24460 [Ramlibacter sp.]|jgi:hypothetical protein|nr:hypothetical protein [Ramlibacter sp.]
MSELNACRFRAADFRQHPALTAAAPHWLRGTVYGRHLLKLKLRQVHPQLYVALVRPQPEHEGLLEAMVDLLDLREWPQPRTLSERVAATREILRMAWEHAGSPGQPHCQQ